MQEVIDNIRREAKADPGEITVGDVVRNIRTKERFVVTIVDEGKLVTGINKVGAPRDYYLLSEVEKTGEHIYSVEEVLALMKEGEDE